MENAREQVGKRKLKITMKLKNDDTRTIYVIHTYYITTYILLIFYLLGNFPQKRQIVYFELKKFLQSILITENVTKL